MLRVLTCAVLLLGAGCSGGTDYGNPPPPPPGPPPPPPPPGGGRSTTITVDNNFYSPTPDTISAGTITFSWAAGAVTHNVIWDSGPSTPANCTNRSSGTCDATLVQGTYNYHCSIHGAGMSGVIVVLP